MGLACYEGLQTSHVLHLRLQALVCFFSDSLDVLAYLLGRSRIGVLIPTTLDYHFLGSISSEDI